MTWRNVRSVYTRPADVQIVHHGVHWRCHQHNILFAHHPRACSAYGRRNRHSYNIQTSVLNYSKMARSIMRKDHNPAACIDAGRCHPCAAVCAAEWRVLCAAGRRAGGGARGLVHGACGESSENFFFFFFFFFFQSYSWRQIPDGALPNIKTEVDIGKHEPYLAPILYGQQNAN